MEKSQDEKKTAFVVLFSAVIMVLEIFFGLFSNSMALLADGIHMGSHVLAIGLSWGAYVLVRHLKRKRADNIDSEKVLTLAAYTSGVLLLLFAIFIIVEAVERFFVPNLEIRYLEAMVVGNRHQTVVVEDQVVDDDGKTVAIESPKMTYEEGVERLKKLSHQIKELGLYDEIIEACNKHDLAGLNKITEKYDKEVQRICNQMDQIMKQMPYPYSY